MLIIQDDFQFIKNTYIFLVYYLHNTVYPNTDKQDYNIIIQNSVKILL